MQVGHLPRYSEIPAKGNPVGLMRLQAVVPVSDRGLVFGRSWSEGIPLGKIPGYWTCPYSGSITGVILNTDRGGYTIKLWKSTSGRSPIADDVINYDGFRINPPDTHVEISSLIDLIETEVIAGDTFAVEVTAVDPPLPTDIAGNVLILKSEEEQ